MKTVASTKKRKLRKMMTEPSVLESQPILYILMRTDMDSMNAGKGMAQATHAANQCVHEIRKSNNKTLQNMLKKWEAESGRGFGTCIVLDIGDIHSLKAAMDSLNVEDQKLPACCGIVLDDTYPLKDGDVVHYLPIQTCGYAFIDKAHDRYRADIVGIWDLHSVEYNV